MPHHEWTKTRQALESRLADCLKKRVSYAFAVHHSKRYIRSIDMPVFYLRVDKQTWFASNQEFYTVLAQLSLNHNSNENADFSAVCQSGYVDVDRVMKYVHQYLNVYSVSDCLESGNYFLYMLAILDRRLGKRRLRKIMENIEHEPVWIRKYIQLRAEAEGMVNNNRRHDHGI